MWAYTLIGSWHAAFISSAAVVALVALSPEGDAWFPEFDQGQWKLVSNLENPAEGDKPAYNFEVWEKA